MRPTLYMLLGLCALLMTACGGDDEDEPGKNGQETADVTLDDSYTYELPVVFQVLYKDKSDPLQYVPASRLADILRYVNEIYQGDVYTQDGTESENVRVKFVLATRDENGKKMGTAGVNYVKVTGDYPIDCDDFMTSSSGAYTQYIWDPNEYINIVMYNFKEQEGSGTTLGISHMPYAPAGVAGAPEGLETTERRTIKKANLGYPHCSSINSLYVDYQSTRYTQNDKGAGGYSYDSRDIVLTIAHELGHYLGLYHTFAEGATGSGYAPLDDCQDTDYCEDTPSYNNVEYNEYLRYYMAHTTASAFNLNDLLYRTNCEGGRFDSVNIMDYSVCLGNQITADQKARMRWVLYNSPLIPGPKKTAATSRMVLPDSGETGIVQLPVRTIK